MPHTCTGTHHTYTCVHMRIHTPPHMHVHGHINTHTMLIHTYIPPVHEAHIHIIYHMYRNTFHTIHIYTHTYVLYMHTKTHIHAHITHIHIIFYGLWFGCGVTYRPNLRAGLKFPFPRVSTLPSIYNSYSTWLRIMLLKHQPRSWKSAQNCPPVPQKT